jgi:hypothetical protein
VKTINATIDNHPIKIEIVKQTREKPEEFAGVYIDLYGHGSIILCSDEDGGLTISIETALTTLETKLYSAINIENIKQTGSAWGCL